jgi:hypothetical protein
MNDELTNLITNTQQKIINAINESGLHPMILQMMLNDIQHQIADSMRNVPPQEQGEKKNE